MKRILTLILVLALALTTFVGCEFIGQLFPGFGECKEHVDENGDYICDKCEAEIHQHNYVDGECECGEKDPHVHNYVDGVCECGATDAEYEDLLSASAYIRQLYKDDATYTPDDLTLVGKVEVGSSKFTVVWTVSSDKITVVASPDGSTVVIDVPEVTEDSTEEIPYTLTATITSENGYTTTRTFDRIVPKFQVNTFEDYLNAETGDPLMVEGIVVLINSKSAGNSRNNLFVMDATGVGGYYNYQMDADPIKDLGIQVGMTVRISGEAAPYNGLPEFKNASVKIIDETIKTFDYIDITDKFQNDTNFNALVALPVVIKGVTIGDQDLSEKSQYMYFTVNGVKSYVRTYVTDFPAGVLDADDKATIDALHKANYGNTADVYGVMITYSGAPYIIPISVDCFTNIKVPDRTDAEKLALELEALNSVPDAFVENTVYTLPTVGASYDTVKFAWASDKDCIVVDGGTLTVTLPAEKTTVTLTLTATIGELSETKTFEITVNSSAIDWKDTSFALEVCEGLENGATTEEFYYFYGTVGEIYNTGYCNFYLLDESGASIVVYGLYAPNGTDRYGSNRQIAEIPFKEGDLICMRAQIQKYYKSSDGSITPELVNAVHVETPAKGTEFFVGYNATEALEICNGLENGATTEEFFYFSGTVGEIYNTGYCNFYLTDANGGSIIVYGLYAPNGTDRYGSNREIAEIPFKAGDSICLRAKVQKYYKSSDGSITPELVSAVLVSFSEAKEEHTHSYEATVTAPTCIKGGYTTHACECSDKYTDTETAALGHTIAEGVCSTCGAKVATVVEANTTASAQENEKFTTEMYIVTGVIDEIASTKYGNCYIKDAEGNKLYVYGLYDLTNTRYDAMTVKPVVGDTITVTGVVGNYNGAQMKNGVVTDLVAHTHDYTALANKCGVCGGITEHTCADADNNNACDLCGADITSYVFTKATSVAAGDTIVLVNDTDKKQMTTLGAQTYGEIADYTTNPSGAIVLTVELVSEGVYALKTADGKYASWSSGSGNKLNVASARDDEGKTTSWKISFDADGNAVIESCVEEGRTIRYNSSSPRFAAYGANSSVTGKIQIYTRTEA